ncbi:hypothetical protein [Xanthomonas campestris]|uniref:hypothetical protein n=1 Tax=Xanthomonas campestris TaxID=339 RepID=UPI002368C93E|nr:hypothetical protein [Xanthomonas campestris]MCW1981149.1 hypothetical protein [Xanthomonas campestris]MCW2006484.1 hypothetical protein [Xanthomonas campestris]WDI95988.1 hypothetical protein JH280_10750 [Xanthomonas campestris]
MSQLFGQVQDAITVASLAAGLLVYAPWLIGVAAAHSLLVQLCDSAWGSVSQLLRLIQ